jgi:hypothetical protein
LPPKRSQKLHSCFENSAFSYHVSAVISQLYAMRFALALCALLLLALDSAFGNPHSAIGRANFFMDDPNFSFSSFTI